MMDFLDCRLSSVHFLMLYFPRTSYCLLTYVDFFLIKLQDLRITVCSDCIPMNLESNLTDFLDKTTSKPTKQKKCAFTWTTPIPIFSLHQTFFCNTLSKLNHMTKCTVCLNSTKQVKAPQVPIDII